MTALLVGAAGLLVAAGVGWGLYRRPAEAPVARRAAAADPHLPVAAVPTAGDPAGTLQAGLHALALGPGSGGVDRAAGAQDAALQAAVAAALEAQDWSARHLPRRPQLLPQLIQTVNDSDASARSMASIIGQDAVLTGNLLRIANSPVYRLQAKPVDSLQRAVTLVGTDGIRQIISAVLVQPVMQLHSDAFPQFGTVVWEHALLASRAAADHARLVTHEDGFAAQWMGLTQGLGAALVMRQLLDAAWQHGAVPSQALASTLLDTWSLPVASRIAAAWELPPSVHEALLRDGEARGGGLAASLRFARAAASASLLCRHGRISQAQASALLEQLEGTPTHALQWIWRRLHGRGVETLDGDEVGDA
ncbi:HDOD domain-containing protein [Stenotrophomonas sp. VV52]|uniref:HDOD domain-containing protein n=1 Tax=Stenotrophomonas sp. VV52 TaxID=2066958 RepID=UPI000C9E71D2|nr:HDOD domain-containing protein [Stenotrophomonas sp. VV52]